MLSIHYLVSSVILQSVVKIGSGGSRIYEMGVQIRCEARRRRRRDQDVEGVQKRNAENGEIKTQRRR